MKKILSVILIFHTYSSIAQFPDSSSFVSDFDYLIDKLEETHPDPYIGFGGRPFFYREKELVREQLIEIKDAESFFQLVNAFLSRIRDGHTILNFPSSSATTPKRILPFLLRTAQDGLYIHHADVKYKEMQGGLIQKINNIHIEEIINRAYQLIPAENLFGCYENIANLLSNTAKFVPLFGKTDQLEFEISREGKTEKYTVVYQDDIEWSACKSFIEKDKHPILFSQMLDGAGYVRWNTILAREQVEAYLKDGQDANWVIQWAFSYLNEDPSGDIQKDMDKIPSLYQIFAEILIEMKEKRSTDLIIDLRSNGGGMTPMIYPILYMLYGDQYLKTSIDTRYDIRISPLLLKKWNYQNIDLLNEHRGKNYKLGDFILTTLTPVHPSKSSDENLSFVQSYQGVGQEWIRKGCENRPTSLNTYVLISPSTFSAAYHFTYYLWKMGATTIGVTPRQAGNTFMETTDFTLPATGINGSVSNAIQILFPDDPEMGKELVPDFPMYIKDFNEYDFNDDAELLKALDIIKNNSY